MIRFCSFSRIRNTVRAGGLAVLSAAAGLAMAGNTAARAQGAEQIILPYDCSVAPSGAVRARPSSDQAYRILGGREARTFEACSPDNPTRCRTFKVQRFSLSCAGTRVSWPSFYAAIAASTDQRAYMDRGHLYYRLGPRARPDHLRGFRDPFSGRDAMGDGLYDPDGETRAGDSDVAEMPSGFAPMAGVDAVFTPLDPRIAALDDQIAVPQPNPGRTPGVPFEVRPSPPPPKPELTKEREAEKPELAARQGDGAREAVTMTEPPRNATSSPAKTEARVAEAAKRPDDPLPINETKASAPDAMPATAEPSAATSPQPPALSDTGDVAAGGVPVIPKILNAPGARVLADQTTSRETVIAARELPQAPAPEVSRPPTVVPPAAPGLILPPLLLAAVIALSTLAGLVFVLRRQSQTPDLPPLPSRAVDDPALPGLDGGSPAAQPDAQTGRALISVPVPSEPPVRTAIEIFPTGVPGSPDEALAALGLAPGATPDAIRKVVAALRQSWHPDAATDPDERARRESRMKQINVAHDILLRRTAA